MRGKKLFIAALSSICVACQSVTSPFGGGDADRREGVTRL